ncbi:hypothetical protein Taro_018674 [Colocasia esculenta]|uniref:Uncharacterized protein n=1 Tax=Colocasia esculenta TaxID=4460 RepID=A0A843V360_COLES|nr:hypothetical protein [Colocasia esculenta]
MHEEPQDYKTIRSTVRHIAIEARKTSEVEPKLGTSQRQQTTWSSTGKPIGLTVIRRTDRRLCHWLQDSPTTRTTGEPTKSWQHTCHAHTKLRAGTNMPTTKKLHNHTGTKTTAEVEDNTVKCVDTVHGRVDTRPSSQDTQLPDWDRVSTQSLVVSTLVPASRRPFLRKWDSVSTNSVVVSTHSD